MFVKSMNRGVEYALLPSGNSYNYLVHKEVALSGGVRIN